MSKYTCSCVAPGCSECFETDADSTEEAVGELLKQSENHNFDMHEELPIVTEEKKKSLVLKSLKQISSFVGVMMSFVK